jgi:adenosyl cobinamide kinase/adenosyl cobinamide phosphate guanylyltransferase
MALVVITGGARSGKSSAAEQLARGRQSEGAQVTVVVFGRAAVDDTEFEERIARHRSDRPAGFLTLEAIDSFAWTSRASEDGLLVVDCLGTLLGLAMEEAWEQAGNGRLGDAEAQALPADFEPGVHERFNAVCEWLLARHGDTIVVTNEVGDGLVPAYATGRLFRDVLGRANRAFVARADAAYACIAGRVLDLGALPTEATWPED